jgi:TolA-binding protein
MAGGKDLLSRLADAGEEAITRLSKMPGGEQIAGAMHTMRDRMDELQKRVRGLEDLDKRVEALEKQVATLQGAKRAPARRAASATGRTSTARARGRTSASKPTRPAGGSSSSTGGDSPG